MERSSTASQGGSRREATRPRLYEAAVTLIAEQGFSATTVDEIAERAGVAKGTVYYNFASKSVLFEELLRHGVGLLTASLREAARADGPGGPRPGRRPGRDDPRGARLHRPLPGLHPAVRGRAVAHQPGLAVHAAGGRGRRPWRWSRACCARAWPRGEFSEEIDVPLTAAALVGMVLVAALDWKAFQPERSLDDVHAALSRLLQGRVSGPRGRERGPRTRRTPVRWWPRPPRAAVGPAPSLLPRTSPRRNSRHRSSLRAPPCLAPADHGRRKERIAGPAPFRRPVPPVPEPCPSPCLHSLVPAGRSPSARVLISADWYGYSRLRTRAHGAAPPAGHLDVRSVLSPRGRCRWRRIKSLAWHGLR
ncbi:hypothetical protein SCYAM73S_03246 [Streptomyces cyaneofuscatus]